MQFGSIRIICWFEVKRYKERLRDLEICSVKSVNCLREEMIQVNKNQKQKQREGIHGKNFLKKYIKTLKA